jgi:hypothetical protein
LAALASATCAGWEDYDPPRQRDIPEGRGLLSGDDGEFAVELDLDPEREQPEHEQDTEEAPTTGVGEQVR